MFNVGVSGDLFCCPSCRSAGGGFVHPEACHAPPGNNTASLSGKPPPVPPEQHNAWGPAAESPPPCDDDDGTPSTSSPSRDLELTNGLTIELSPEATSRNLASENSGAFAAESSPAEVTSRNMAASANSVFALVPTAEALAMLNSSFGDELYGLHNAAAVDNDDDDAYSIHTFYTAASVCESAMSTRPPSPRCSRLSSSDAHHGGGGEWEQQSSLPRDPPPPLGSAALSAKWAAALGRTYDEALTAASASSASALTVVPRQHSVGRSRQGAGSSQVRVLKGGGAMAGWLIIVTGPQGT